MEASAAIANKLIIPSPLTKDAQSTKATQLPVESNLELLIPPKLRCYMVTVAEVARSPLQPPTLFKTWSSLILKDGRMPLLFALVANYGVSLPVAATLGWLCEKFEVPRVATSVLTWIIPTLSWHATFMTSLFTYEHIRSILSKPKSEAWPYIKENLKPYLKLSAAMEITWLSGLMSFQTLFYAMNQNASIAVPIANVLWGIPFNFLIIPLYYTAQKSGIRATLSKLWEATKWTAKKWTIGFGGACMFRGIKPAADEQTQQATLD